MGKKKKPRMEFRYYKMPAGSPILALLGQKWVQNYGRDIDYLHFHNYLEIGYCYSGRGTMVLGKEEVRFAGGDFTVIPKNFPHTTNSDQGNMSKWEYLFIDVEGFLQKVCRDNPKQAELMIRRIYARAVKERVGKEPEIAKKIRKIMELMRNTEEFYMVEVKGTLAALLAEIARKNRRLEEPLSEDGRDGKMTGVVSDALDCITLHYMDPTVKVEDLAKWCHLSETHFRRVFTEHMKMSPTEYLNLVRIQASCDYLKTTDEQISDIAHKCGFSTVSTFNRNFKQVMGIPPHEWRKRPENYERQLLKFQIHSEEGW